MATSQIVIANVDTAPTYAVVFPTPLDSANYVAFITTFKSNDNLASIGGEIDPDSLTVNGFNVINLNDTGKIWVMAQLAYDVDFEAIPTTQRLSRDWTAHRLWLEAARSVKFNKIAEMDFDKLRLINNVIAGIADKYKPLIGHRYITTEDATIVSNTIDVSGLRLMSLGGERGIRFKSDVAGVTTRRMDTAQEVEHFRAYQNKAYGNRNTIVYALEGDTLHLGKGYSLASYATAPKVDFLRVPTEVTDATQKIDLPDGALMELAKTVLGKEIQYRYMNVMQDTAKREQELDSEIRGKAA